MTATKCFNCRRTKERVPSAIQFLEEIGEANAYVDWLMKHPKPIIRCVKCKE